MIEIEAQVARVLSASEIAINAGASKGVQEGDQVTVWRKVEIHDPESDEPLGSVLRSRLRLDVTLVEELFCLAKVRVQAPNFMANIFGRQTAWITGAEVEEGDHVPLKSGDKVMLYTDANVEKRDPDGRELTD